MVKWQKTANTSTFPGGLCALSQFSHLQYKPERQQEVFKRGSCLHEALNQLLLDT